MHYRPLLVFFFQPPGLSLSSIAWLSRDRWYSDARSVELIRKVDLAEE
jgi:hypothetical protein